MARQTRQQRRDRRAQTAAPARRAPARAAAVTADGAGDGRTPPRPPAERRTRFGFFGESWAELKKVEWPGQQQLIQGTIVVLIACLVVGVYLYGNDQLWRRVVHHFLIK